MAKKYARPVLLVVGLICLVLTFVGIDMTSAPDFPPALSTPAVITPTPTATPNSPKANATMTPVQITPLAPAAVIQTEVKLPKCRFDSAEIISVSGGLSVTAAVTCTGMANLTFSVQDYTKASRLVAPRQLAEVKASGSEGTMAEKVAWQPSQRKDNQVCVSYFATVTVQNLDNTYTSLGLSEMSCAILHFE